MSKKYPLLNDEIESIKENPRETINYEIVDRILRSVYDYKLHGLEEKSEQEKGHYPYVPFSREYFIELIIENQNLYNKKSFIDIGCGIGDKVILAEIFGNFDSVTGIELNLTTYQVAKYFCLIGQLQFQAFSDYFKEERGYRPKIKREILNVNAFDYNFSQHDFIYMYSPIHNSDLLGELYKKVLLEIPIGGIILEVLHTQHLVNVAKNLGKVFIRKEAHYYDNCVREGSIVRKTKNSFIVENKRERKINV